MLVIVCWLSPADSEARGGGGAADAEPGSLNDRVELTHCPEQCFSCWAAVRVVALLQPSVCITEEDGSPRPLLTLL